MGIRVGAVAWAVVLLSLSGCVTYEEIEDADPAQRSGEGPPAGPASWPFAYVPRAVQSAGGTCAQDCPRVSVTYVADEVGGSSTSSTLFINRTFAWAAAVDAIPPGKSAHVLVSRPGDYQTLACPATPDSCALSGTTVVPVMVQRNLSQDSTWLRVAMQVLSDEAPPRPIAQHWNLTVLSTRNAN